MAAKEKRSHALLWAGAGCVVIIGAGFMFTVLGAGLAIYRGFSGGGYGSPPPFTAQVTVGDGLITLEPEHVLSDGDNSYAYGARLQVFQDRFYATESGWLYVFDPATGDVHFDPIEQWSAYLTPYDGADGERHMGVINTSFDGEGISAYDDNWDIRWTYEPTASVEGYVLDLDYALSADINGDGVLETIISINFYPPDEDMDYYDSPSPLSEIANLVTGDESYEDENNTTILLALDTNGELIWRIESDDFRQYDCVDIDGVPGDEVVIETADGSLYPLDSATGERAEKLGALPGVGFALLPIAWPPSDAGTQTLFADCNDTLSFFDPLQRSIVQTVDCPIDSYFFFRGAAVAKLRPDLPPFLVVLLTGSNEDYDTVSHFRVYNAAGELVYDEACALPLADVATFPQPDGTDALYFLGAGTLYRASMVLDPQ